MAMIGDSPKNGFGDALGFPIHDNYQHNRCCAANSEKV